MWAIAALMGTEVVPIRRRGEERRGEFLQMCYLLQSNAVVFTIYGSLETMCVLQSYNDISL